MHLPELLQSTFGFPAFRANQEAVCRAATDGRDVLLVMPTGAGKSLCYQLPAIARGGTALVISPLIALMEDQAGKLLAAGLRVGRIHSGLSRDEARQACRDYLDGRLQFLMVAPERMRVPGFIDMLARRKPSLIAIDEAHCISAWGHDFRPDYRTLGDFLPALRPAPIIALTATATPTVQRDIVAQLQLNQPALFIHGFRRENLAIEVLELSKPQRSEFIVKHLARAGTRPAIVYAPSRKVAEELAGALGRHLPAAAYHAGLDASTRERVQRHFIAGKVEVVVATIAFGMGIDKADVRTVIHAALPASVEAYYQEIGRAGRDGLPAKTVLLHSYADRKMHEFFLERDYPPLPELARVTEVLTDDFLMPEILAQRLRMDREVFAKAAEKLAAHGVAQIDMDGLVRRVPESSAAWKGSYDLQVAFRRGQIEKMATYAETQQCRMAALIRHFGDIADAHRPCAICDFCAPGAGSAQAFAEPSQTEERDLRKLLRVLTGGRSVALGKLFTESAVSKDRKYFDSLVNSLARAGLVSITSETWTNPEGNVLPYRKVLLTHEGKTLASSDALGVLLPRGEGRGPGADKPGRKSKEEPKTASYTEAQRALESKLRAWRKSEAAETGKPAFIVFSDAVLHALVLAGPRTIPELTKISGIGAEKADRYGAILCAICRNESPAPEPVAGSQPAELKAKPKLVDFPREQVRVAVPSETFTRPGTGAASVVAALDTHQQELDRRLRDWRKTQAEGLGLPQFFVMGSSTLRSIVLSRPENLKQLAAIPGMDSEKVERFGPSILDACQRNAAAC